MTSIYHLTFQAKVGKQNRIVIDPNTTQIANIKQGDIVTLTLTEVHKQTGGT